MLFFGSLILACHQTGQILSGCVVFVGRCVIGKIRQRFDTVVCIAQGTDFPYSKTRAAYPQNGRVAMARLRLLVRHDSRYLHRVADNNQPLGAVSLGLDMANDVVRWPYRSKTVS